MLCIILHVRIYTIPSVIIRILYFIFLGDDFHSDSRVFTLGADQPLLISIADLAVDDPDPEFTEGLVLYVEVDEIGLGQQVKLIDVVNRLVLVSIEDNDRTFCESYIVGSVPSDSEGRRAESIIVV